MFCGGVRSIQNNMAALFHDKTSTVSRFSSADKKREMRLCNRRVKMEPLDSIARVLLLGTGSDNWRSRGRNMRLNGGCTRNERSWSGGYKRRRFHTGERYRFRKGER